MISYDVNVTSEAQSDIKNLDAPVQIRILDKREWIGESAEYLPHQNLQGEEWAGCFKYRIGDYRII